MTLSPPERFWAKVDTSGDCWLWTASVISGPRGGYGQFHPGGGHGVSSVKAHIWAYEFLVGPIPTGLQLDHLCRVRRCVNPDHLEPVTGRVNVHRSPLTPAARTACPSGHEYDSANTYIDKTGRRHCRACKRTKRRVLVASRRAA